MSIDPATRSAVEAWARTERGAPRRFSELIVDEKHGDQTVERVYTRVVRRDLDRVRFATTERRSTVASVDARTLDPFAFTEEQLKVASQQIVHCEGCGASGRSDCGTCRASGTVTCRQCNGLGNFRNPSTNRMNQCKVCKKTGRMACGTCVGDGKVNCRDCGGSGHQLTWLRFDEHTKRSVAIEPDGTYSVAHPALAEQRAMTETDLAAFAIEQVVEAHGPLSDAQRAASRGIVERELGKLDQRVERVVEQQYVRVAILERTVIYRMCGTDGAVVLSGNGLTPARTEDAIRPIRRRLRLTALLVAAFAAGLLGLWLVLGHLGAYFARANAIIGCSIAAAIVLAIPSTLALLRNWQRGVRLRRPRGYELALGMGTLVLAGLSIAVNLAARPSVAEVDAALAAGDLAGAQTVLDALRRTGTSPDLLDAEDRVALVEASKLEGDPRLEALDRIAARQGRESAGAAATARAERLAVIRAANRDRHPDRALAALKRWFPDSNDPEIREENALAVEVAGTACREPVCSYDVALHAAGAHPTKARTARLATAKQELLDALGVPATPPKEVRDRLVETRRLDDVAARASKLPADPAITERIGLLTAWTAAERAKVALLGSSFEIAAILLPGLTRSESSIAVAHLDGGVDAYLAFNGDRCRGVYAVGSKEHLRSFVSSKWTLTSIIAQALGRPGMKPPESGTVRSWWDGTTPIVARYREAALAELRIGDASP